MPAVLIALLLATLVPLSAGDAPKPPVTVLAVTADHPDAIYALKETARFSVALTLDGKPVAGRGLKWTIVRDGSGPLSGTLVSAETPATVEATLDHPGFALCTVVAADDPKLVGRGGAGFDPGSIRPSAEPPADFAEFWAAKKAELAKIPMNPVLTPVEIEPGLKGKAELFDLRLDCVGGVPVSGYYARPVGAAKGSCPAIVSYHGAGVRSSGRPGWKTAKGRIALDINAHGIDNGKDDAFYSELATGRLKGYPGFGKDDRETSYFVGMFLRVVRALEFMKAQPEWDGRILIVTGGSQGGAQALVAAGLDPQVTFCVAHVPAMCDHQSVLAGRAWTWPRWIAGKDGKPDNQAARTASQYFDAAFFARQSRAESLLSTGFVDTTCPPVTVYAAYANLPGKKSIINSISNGHDVPASANQAAEKAIDDHVAAMRAAKP